MKPASPSPRTPIHNPGAPRTIENFQARLIEMSDTLPKKLRQCADYIAAFPDRIAVSTVAEFALAAKVQPSACIRFCQLMGFSGYSEMQRIFRNHQARQWPDYATRIENLLATGEDSPPALLAEFVEAGRASLENLANQLDPAELNRAVNALSGASVIHIAGLNRAYPVASYLSYAFEKMSIPTMQHDYAGNFDRRHSLLPGDVLLVTSFAPYSSETVELASHAHKQGNRIIAITDSLNSPFHRMDAIVLRVSEADVGAFRALSATLSLTTALAVSVGIRRDKIQFRK